MKNVVIGALVCLVAVLAIGVQPTQKVFNEVFHRGTLRGVDNCMNFSATSLLSPDAIRTSCVTDFQKRLYGQDHATGRAGPYLVGDETGWDGRLENKSPDHVTTWVQISVGIYDESGDETRHLAHFPIWIEPNDEADFKVLIPDLARETFEDLEFCDLSDEEPENCMSWGIEEVMGLSI